MGIKRLSGVISLFIFLSLAVHTVSAQVVVINEFSPTTDPEWVEFYNASDSAEYDQIVLYR